VRWLSVIALATVVSWVGGCGDDPIAIHHGDGDADYNRAELMTAIDAYVTAGRTVEAYGVLAAEVTRLRPGMDATVAEVAELQLVVLAAAPIRAMASRPPTEQVAKLALTVWAVALAPPIHVFAPDGWRDPSEALVAVRPGETAEAYVERLCGGPLAFDCQHIVPEWQGAVVGAEAITHLTARARTALANCEECSDPAWRTAVSRWEALDRESLMKRRLAETAGSPSRWPPAGAAAQPWPAIPPPRLVLEADGDWFVNGDVIDPPDRAAALAELRAGGADALAVHALPAGRLAALDALLTAAGTAGFREVAVEARVENFPWPRRAYLLRAGKAPKRRAPIDTVQLYLRSLDAAVPPR
jgi:hypothetical protein